MWDFLKETFLFLLNVQGLLEWGGLFLVCTIIFAETGLFFGFFLPGDSLLVTAGVFAFSGRISLPWLLGLASLCAMAGDQVGYWIGHKAGKTLYKREDSFLFKKRHLARAHDFYEKYGGKTIVLARFVPVVRTFAPAVAGAAAMNYRRFVAYNCFGGLLWVMSMVLTGYFLGSAIPDVESHIHLVIAIVVILSILPALAEVIRAKGRSQEPEG
jgi:membrane-associated protein